MGFIGGLFRRIDADVAFADFAPVAGGGLLVFGFFFRFGFRGVFLGGFFFDFGAASGAAFGGGFGSGGTAICHARQDRSEPAEADEVEQSGEESTDQAVAAVILGGRFDGDVDDVAGMKEDAAKEEGLPQEKRPQPEGFQELGSPGGGDDALIEEIGDGGEVEESRECDRGPGTPAISHFSEESARDPVSQADGGSDPDECFVAVDFFGPEVEERFAPESMSSIEEHEAVKNHEEGDGTPEAIGSPEVVLAVRASPKNQHRELSGGEEQQGAVPASQGEGSEVEESSDNRTGPRGELCVVVSQEREGDSDGDSEDQGQEMGQGRGGNDLGEGEGELSGPFVAGARGTPARGGTPTAAGAVGVSRQSPSTAFIHSWRTPENAHGRSRWEDVPCPNDATVASKPPIEVVR